MSKRVLFWLGLLILVTEVCSATTTNVTISGQSKWLSTGVTISPEAVVTIEATGEWCGAPWSCYGPDGTGGIAPGAFLAPGLSSGGLVGKIGNNSPFFVGSMCSFNGQDHGTGILYLAFNDDKTGYYNNSGSLNVTITTNEEGNPSELAAPFTQSSPSIDGVIGGAEWQDAEVYTLTFHSSIDQTTATAPVYFLNDGTYLYCASTVPFSSSSTAYFGIYIDGDHSHSINGTMSEPHVDMGYNKAGTNSPLYPIYDAYWAEVPPCGVLWSDMVTPPSGAEHAYSGSSSLSYEFKIPLSDMGVVPGGAIGIHVQFSPNSSIGYQYPSADYCDIASWPDLYIAPPAQQGGNILVYSTSGTYPASSDEARVQEIQPQEGERGASSRVAKAPNESEGPSEEGQEESTRQTGSSESAPEGNSHLGGSWSSLGYGVHGTVRAMASYEGVLVVGGENLSLSGSAATEIDVASWDGSTWSSMQSGVGGSFGIWVGAVTPYRGEFIVGGDFTSAGGSRALSLATWDGNKWSAIDSWLEGFSYVHALAVYRGKLVVGGDFHDFCWESSKQFSGIAGWDGSSWSCLGSGFGGGAVQSLIQYQGLLIAGGGFGYAGGSEARNIAAWDGAAWSSLGSGIDGGVTALAVFNGQLVAGGRFSSAGGVQANNIALWDGTSWHNMLEGLDGTVHALCEYKGRLIAGGEFNHAGGADAHNLAAWDGSSWSEFGGGIGEEGSSGIRVLGLIGSRNSFVRALLSVDGKLFVGGSFSEAGGKRASNIAVWSE